MRKKSVNRISKRSSPASAAKPLAGRSQNAPRAPLRVAEGADFGGMLERWRDRPDHPIIRDMSDRGDKAVRRSLWEAARIWMPEVRRYRGDFVTFAKSRHVRGSNPENMLVRLLFGTRLPAQRVTDYVRGVRYWYDHPDAPLAEAEMTGLNDTIYRGHPGGHADSEYVITPPATRAFLEKLLGKPFNPFDPFPAHRPAGFDGLMEEWPPDTYGNPPFVKSVLIAAAKKAIEESREGKTITLAMPLPLWSAQQLLIDAGAEIVALGRVPWLHRETGEPTEHPNTTGAFILRKPLDRTITLIEGLIDALMMDGRVFPEEVCIPLLDTLMDFLMDALMEPAVATAA